MPKPTSHPRPRSARPPAPDTPALRRTQDALRTSQEKLALAVDGAGLGIWDWDMLTGEIVWNERCKAIFGLPPGSKVTFATAMEAIHPDDRTAALEAATRSFAGQTGYELEYRSRWPDGTVRWIAARGFPYANDAGEMVRMSGVALDVTARHLAEQALRVSGERMRQAVCVSGLGIFEHDHRTDVITWSPELRQIYGVGPEEPVSLPMILAFYHPDDRARITTAIQRAHDPAWDGVYADESRIVRRDGRVRWLVRHAQTFFSEESGALRPVRTVGAAFDITARKEAEESLRKSERRYHTLAESIPAMLWAWDAQGLTIDQNRRWQEYTGLRLAEWQGDGWKKAVHPDDVKRAEQCWLQAVGSGEDYEIEYRLRRASDGSYRWHSASGVATRDERGRVTGWFGTCVDITERKQAGEALRKSREKLRAAIAGADLGTWDWDLVSNTLVWDVRCKAMAGLPPSAAVNYDVFMSTMHPDDRERANAAALRAIETQLESEVDYRTVWPDGSVHWVVARGCAYADETGRPVRFTGVTQDITERKRAELEIRNLNATLEQRVSERTAELRQANRELLAEIAERRRLEGEVLKVSELERRSFGQDLHDDVCQQLAGIAMMNQALARRLGKNNPAEAAEAQRLARLLGEAVAHTRALARGLHPVEVEANGLMAALQELATRASLRVPCRVECRAPVLVADDTIALHLYRIAQEAVANALKHAGAREIIIGLRQQRRRIILSIQDDGAGLSTKKGKGMGLHIMPYRARMIGATLIVSGERGQGTQVVCSLRAGT